MAAFVEEVTGGAGAEVGVCTGEIPDRSGVEVEESSSGISGRIEEVEALTGGVTGGIAEVEAFIREIVVRVGADVEASGVKYDDAGSGKSASIEGLAGSYSGI